MVESNLDWKKVFKKVLGSSSCSENTTSNQYESSDDCDTADSSFNFSSKSELCESNISEESSIEITNDSKQIHSESQTSCYSDREDGSFNPDENSKISKGNNACPSNFTQSCEIPEWNKVFKDILGNNSVAQTEIKSKEVKKEASKQKCLEVNKTFHKPGPSQSPRRPMENSKKMFYNKHTSSPIPVEKIKNRHYKNKKMSKEEKEVRELFSRCFVLSYVKSVNELSGCGVDTSKIYKAQKEFLSSLPQGVQSGDQDESSSCEDSCDEKIVDMSFHGRTANIKPANRDNTNMPPIPFDEEPWDKDFLL